MNTYSDADEHIDIADTIEALRAPVVIALRAPVVIGVQTSIAEVAAGLSEAYIIRPRNRAMQHIKYFRWEQLMQTLTKGTLAARK